ncbi:MAG: acyl-CoA dehydrogenase, partial [Thermoplasmata archaeon]
MYEFLLDEREKAFWKEVREFVKNEVPSQYIRDMDEGKLESGRWFVERAGAKTLL